MRNHAVRKSILLVCSDPVIRSVVQGILQNEGHVVLSARDLGEAVARLEEASPKLLIMFAYLESISGHDAAIYLRTKCHGLPVMLLSGMPDHDEVRVRAESQSFEIFPKPFAPADLIAKVNEMLSRDTAECEPAGQEPGEQR